MGPVPGSGRPPGGGNGNPLQYSCLGNPTDRGAWWATVQGVTKSWTRLSTGSPKLYLSSVGSHCEGYMPLAVGLEPSSCFLRNYSPAGTPCAGPSVSVSSWVVSALFLQVVAHAILGGREGGREKGGLLRPPALSQASPESRPSWTHPPCLASALLSLDPFSPHLTSPSDIQPT